MRRLFQMFVRYLSFRRLAHLIDSSSTAPYHSLLIYWKKYNELPPGLTFDTLWHLGGNACIKEEFPLYQTIRRELLRRAGDSWSRWRDLYVRDLQAQPGEDIYGAEQVLIQMAESTNRFTHWVYLFKWTKDTNLKKLALERMGTAYATRRQLKKVFFDDSTELSIVVQKRLMDTLK